VQKREKNSSGFAREPGTSSTHEFFRRFSLLLPSAVPSFATWRFPDPRIGLYLEFFLVTLLACIIRRFLGQSGCGTFSKSLQPFIFSFIFSKRGQLWWGGRLGYYLAMSTGLLEYTRPPKHTTGKGHLMWKVWVAGKNPLSDG
jgi:hypothetical protein